MDAETLIKTATLAEVLAAVVALAEVASSAVDGGRGLEAAELATVRPGKD